MCYECWSEDTGRLLEDADKWIELAKGIGEAGTTDAMYVADWKLFGAIADLQDQIKTLESKVENLEWEMIEAQEFEGWGE